MPVGKVHTCVSSYGNGGWSAKYLSSSESSSLVGSWSLPNGARRVMWADATTARASGTITTMPVMSEGAESGRAGCVTPRSVVREYILTHGGGSHARAPRPRRGARGGPPAPAAGPGGHRHGRGRRGRGCLALWLARAARRRRAHAHRRRRHRGRAARVADREPSG